MWRTPVASLCSFRPRGLLFWGLSNHEGGSDLQENGQLVPLSRDIETNCRNLGNERIMIRFRLVRSLVRQCKTIRILRSIRSIKCMLSDVIRCDVPTQRCRKSSWIESGQSVSKHKPSDHLEIAIVYRISKNLSSRRTQEGYCCHRTGDSSQACIMRS
jgi:hypothetical protein